MAKIIWTENALNDLESIAEYISKDSEYYARMMLRKLFFSTTLIQQYPLAGKMVPELKNTQIREIIHGSYRVNYEIKASEVYILTVHHQKMLLSNNPLFKS